MRSPLIGVGSPQQEIHSPRIGINTKLIQNHDDNDYDKQKINKKLDKKNENEEEEIPPITLQSEIFEMLNFAWPVTVATIARIIMYTIDTAFLGHLGTAQLAGSAMASLCANLVSTFLFAPAYGLNSLCSQAIGAGNSKLAGNWLQLSLGVSTIMLIPSFIILFFVADIVSPFEHNKSVLKYASIFGKYSTCFLIPTFIYMAIRQYFQALQIVHPATIVSITSVGINVALNQILIHGLHLNIFNGFINIQFDGLGFIGSPLATTCSLTFQVNKFHHILALNLFINFLIHFLVVFFCVT